jgi:flagellar motor switch protein FliN
MADQLDDEISGDELAALLGGMDAAPPPAGATPEPPSAKLDDEISADELEALGLAPSPTPMAPPTPPKPPAPPVATPAPSAPAEGPGPKLPELTAHDEISADAGISLLMDVPLRVSIELGRISMTLQQVLGLGRGSIIELDRLAGEPVDILVNDKLIGRGEVVVIDEYFGVKITELIDPKG